MTEINPNIMPSEKKVCDSCPFFNMIPVIGSDENNPKYFNTYCKYNNVSANGRIIDVRVIGGLSHYRPMWCSKTASSQNKSNKCSSWIDVARKIPFKNIQFGIKYHLPPFGKSKRRDVKVSGKAMIQGHVTASGKDETYYYLTTQDESGQPVVTDYSEKIYEESIVSKLLVINKLPEFKLPEMV